MRAMFDKNQKEYKDLKISTENVKSVIIGLDLHIDTLFRDAKNTFDSYIEQVQMLKNYVDGICVRSTELENDQIDPKHFIRVRGNSGSAVVKNIEFLNDTIDLTKSHFEKYLYIASQINDTLRLREIILEKNKNEPIEKQQDAVELSEDSK